MDFTLCSTKIKHRFYPVLELSGAALVTEPGVIQNSEAQGSGCFETGCNLHKRSHEILISVCHSSSGALISRSQSQNFY